MSADTQIRETVLLDSKEPAPAEASHASRPPERSRLGMWAWRAFVVLLVIAAFYVGRATQSFRQLPEIAATLPGDESGFGRELDARVQQRFPLGSSDAKLIAELSRQEFTPEWRERGYANAASFVWRGLLCTKVVRVIWRADDQGAIAQINGEYQRRCAL